MPKVFISMSGEGRGHATRVRAVVEQLRRHHQVTLYASGEAFAFLAPLYRRTEVIIRRISGLRFHYTQDRRVNFSKTGEQAWRFARRLPLLVNLIKEAIHRDRPDLAITDFEPALPRAARVVGLPFISINHQHFLLHYDLRALPLVLRLRARILACVVRAWHSPAAETIVSSFYFPPLKRGSQHVTQTGVLLRPEVLAVTPSNDGHLVAYLRRFAGENVISALASCGRPVRVYGLGERPACGNLSFRAIHEQRFLEDLSTADALVSTAGNQLIGEALSLGKPVLAMPEARNYEQCINAFFLQQSGAGETVGLECLDAAQLNGFLSRLDAFRGKIDAPRMNGLPAVMNILRRHLPDSVCPPVHAGPTLIPTADVTL